ncbi:hypothetical protein [Micromonospora palomenae]|uniref:hypothetical protein n=1 Tax=Micromonospora palomenae TaxID=1461247 RepID=UPI0012B8CB14|nr:hypothetical protein [Micromonospora palomenae]
MLELSDDLLQLEPGRIVYLSPLRSGPAAGTWAITVPLAPFSAADRFDPATFRPGTDGPEIIRTAIRGEFIDLPGNDLSALTNRTFDFPINPHAGYIDASIYLGGGHNPVDITRMEFGEAHSLNIDVVLHAAFDFTEEGVEIANRSAVLHANLQFEQLD